MWRRFKNEGHRLVVTAFMAGERLAKAADRLLRPDRLSLAQFNLMVVLDAQPRGIPQTLVGRTLIVSRANVTGLVRRLRRRGLCAVAPDSADRRVKRVRLTPPGRRALRRLRAAYFREIRRATADLRNADMRRASDVMDALIGADR